MVEDIIMVGTTLVDTTTTMEEDTEVDTTIVIIDTDTTMDADIMPK
jgi:hypothetical protein